MKKLDEHRDLYVQSDALLLANVFNNFQNLCLKVYCLDPAHFLSALVLIALASDVGMLLMVER